MPLELPGRVVPRFAGTMLFIAGLVLPGGVAAADSADMSQALAMADSGRALAVQFNPAFFPSGPNAAGLDISRFNAGNVVLPGTYRADVYVNGHWQGRRDVLMRTGRHNVVAPCLDVAGMAAMGIAVPERKDGAATGDCVEPELLLPEARAVFDVSALRLDLSIPQASLARTAQGAVSPEQWQAGMPLAGFVNYSATAFHIDNGALASTQSYLGLGSGINVAGWRLRQSGNLTHSDIDGQASQTHYQTIATYAQHDITRLRAQLTLGDAYTAADIFPAVAYRGLQLASDDRMQPDSLLGFAPVVRGVADGNAEVRISQHGNVIWQQTVAAGPFVISDLYNTGYAGDLDVTVTEANGSIKQFTVPYAVVPFLLREDMSRFSLVGGELRQDNLSEQPEFAQGTYQRGLGHELTLYGGGIVARDYLSLALGAAINTRLGAFSADVTRATASDLPGLATDEELSGESLRLSYAKLLDATRTNITVASYLLTTADYLTLTDAALWRYGAAAGAASVADKVRDVHRRVQLSLDQPLSTRDRVFATGIWQDDSDHDLLQYQAGYSRSWSWGNTSLTLSRTHNTQSVTLNGVPDGVDTTEALLSVTVPLGRSPHAPMLTSRVSGDDRQNGYAQLMVSGTTLSRHELAYSYGASRNWGDDDSGSVNGSLTHTLPVTTLSASASAGHDYLQLSAGASGAVVFFPGGVLFGQPVGESFAVVSAPGAEGATISNGTGIVVNGDGYAVLPYLTPYHRNDVSLDPRHMVNDVDLSASSTEAVPRAGAILNLSFSTDQGRAALVQLSMSGPFAQDIPVGADVLDAQGASVGMVGQGRMVFLRGQADRPLRVKWGEDAGSQCVFSYHLAGSGSAARGVYQRAQTDCHSLMDPIPAGVRERRP